MLNSTKSLIAHALLASTVLSATVLNLAGTSNEPSHPPAVTQDSLFPNDHRFKLKVLNRSCEVELERYLSGARDQVKAFDPSGDSGPILKFIEHMRVRTQIAALEHKVQNIEAILHLQLEERDPDVKIFAKNVETLGKAGSEHARKIVKLIFELGKRMQEAEKAKQKKDGR